jgi:hypothetical protein
MLMRECPKYNDCNVPICPLDPDWKLRTLCTGEATCPYILEAGKPGAEERFKQYAPEMWAVATGPVAQAIVTQFPQVAYAREKARTTGSRMEADAQFGARMNALRSEEV